MSETEGNENIKPEKKVAIKDDKEEIEMKNLDRAGMKHKELTRKAKMHLKPQRGTATKDYLTMKREETDIKDRPEWDRSQNSLTMCMIDSRKSMNTALKLLEAKRVEHDKFCRERDKQIVELEAKADKFRESFEFFDEFVRDNIEKRDRAEERIKKERETRVQLSEEICKVKERIVHIRQLKENMKNAILDNHKFEEFLIAVGKAVPQEFSSDPEKIVERYQLLNEVRTELAKQRKLQVESLHETSVLIDEEADESSEQLIDLSNLLTDLHHRRQLASQEVYRWTYVLKRVNATASEMALEYEQSQAAVNELYLQVCRESGIKSATPDPSRNSEQMKVILDRILELRKVLKVARRRSFANLSDVPNTSFSVPLPKNKSKPPIKLV